MKVVEVKSWIVDCYRTNWIIVKIVTDDGLYGYGEATLEYKEKSVFAAIEEIQEELIGQNPFHIEKIHNAIRRESYYRSGPILSSSLGAVDMALWDIKAKALDLPVYELLGGKIRDTLRIYANGWFAGATAPQEFAEKAVQMVAKGHSALKWDPFGSMYLEVTRKDLQEIDENIRAVREAVGMEVDLMIEGHGRFNLTAARKISDVIKAYSPTWFEEPIIPGNNHALRDLRMLTEVPVAAGERTYSMYDVHDLLKIDAIDVLQSDVAHIGGITELKRAAVLASVHSISISPHNPNGPICNMATVHVASTCENFNFLETMETDVPWRNEIFVENITFRDGEFVVPDTPGLGIEVNEKLLDKYPYTRKSLRHYKGTLTSIRPPNSTIWYQEKG